MGEKLTPKEIEEFEERIRKEFEELEETDLLEAAGDAAKQAVIITSITTALGAAIGGLFGGPAGGTVGYRVGLGAGVGLSSAAAVISEIHAERIRIYKRLVDTFGSPSDVDAGTAATAWSDVINAIHPYIDPNHYGDPLAENMDPPGETSLYEGVKYAASKLGLTVSQFWHMIEMLDSDFTRDQPVDGELVKDIIQVRTTLAKGPSVKAPDGMITGDLDAMDRLALGGHHPALRAILDEAQSHAFLSSGFNQPFAEGDEPFAEVDDRWANYKKQGQVPPLTDDEGLIPGTWNLEQSQAHTRDWTSGLPDATGAGPEWSQGAGPIWDPAYGVPFSPFGQAADEMRYFQNTAGSELNTMGNELEHTANSALRMQDAADAASFELWELEYPQLGIRDDVPVPAVPMGGESAYPPNFGVLAQDAADAASFELWELEHPQLGIRDGVPVSAEAMGGELERTADSALRMQDAVGGASFELWELEHPLLSTRDGALGLADAMGGGDGGLGLTGAIDNAGLAADGLALSTGTAEQALLAAGLTGDSTTQVLDLMRSAGLDPATSAWGELAAAVHVWGDATDTEVGRVIGRLGQLARVQGGGGPGSAGSSRSGSSGGDPTGVNLGQLMSLAKDVAKARADRDNLNPEHRAHELGKVLGQLGAPGSVAEKLALLRRFFAGSAGGISFGLGPSAGSMGFHIPQFAAGGTVPGPLGAPQLIVAHGGEHIVPHRATGSPTIIRIELDREVLSQAVLGDLLRLQGREVTLGLS